MPRGRGGARGSNTWLAPSARYLQVGTRCDSHIGGGPQGDPIHGSRPQITVLTAPTCRAAPLYINMDKAMIALTCLQTVARAR